MSELSPRAREILEAARRVPCAPDEQTTRRIERAVLIAGTTTALTVGGLKAASSGLASKAVMAAVTIAIVGTTAAVTVAVLPAGFGRSTSRPVRPVPPVQVNNQTSAPSPSTPEITTQAEVAVSPLPDPLPEKENVSGESVPREIVPKVRPALPLTPPPVITAEPASTLAAELALLRTAKNELDASRWAAALEALARHDAEFPEGALKVEAEVIRVLAWCGQGRAGDALQRAFELRTKTPNSPAIARLVGSCVDL